MRYITLPFAPRNYQLEFAKKAGELIESKEVNRWHLFSAPTGSGKSLAALLLMQQQSGGMLITPRVEIIYSFLRLLGEKVDRTTLKNVIDCAWGHNITTPIRLRNELASGKLDRSIRYLLIDEAHHSLANTYDHITTYVPFIPVVGLTATPFRGTPKETAKFRDQWGGKVHHLIHMKECADKKYIAFPTFKVEPLIDDDLIDMDTYSGDFSVRGLDNAIYSCTDSVVKIIERYFNGYEYDRPTMISVPSTAACDMVSNALRIAGFPVVALTQSNTRTERQLAFADVVACRKVLVQIDIVSEGVDLPLRRAIDLRPTTSPVRFLQQLGRFMRPVSPGEAPPEYLCCNRNLEAHGYLLEGMLPTSTILESQKAFGENKPSIKRTGTRFVGLGNIGRFTYSYVKLANGIQCPVYALVHLDGLRRMEYICILHPQYNHPVVGVKASEKDEESDTRTYGKWVREDKELMLRGCTSTKLRPLTDNQINAWNRLAGRVGLDHQEKPNSRTLAVMFFLLDCNVRFR